jgi:hypothetical protein
VAQLISCHPFLYACVYWVYLQTQYTHFFPLMAQQRVLTAAGLQVSTAHAHVQHYTVVRLTLQ